MRLFICILIPFVVGMLSSWLSISGVDTWYITIVKPSFSPPNWIFGPVWSFLYACIGYSFYLITKNAPKSILRWNIVFSIEQFLCFTFSIILFRFHAIDIAFINILLLWILIVYKIYYYAKFDKKATFLQIPYIIWVSFAMILNGALWYLNR
jgi:tryptophan-rich sensory protein